MTNYHVKYFAHDLTRKAASGLDRLSMSLFDAAVDLNPHQIEGKRQSNSRVDGGGLSGED